MKNRGLVYRLITDITKHEYGKETHFNDQLSKPKLGRIIKRTILPISRPGSFREKANWILVLKDNGTRAPSYPALLGAYILSRKS